MKRYKIKANGKEYDASDYQCAIFDEVEHGVGNMIINASAGSSKTTTIVNCIDLIPSDKRTLFIAFNKEIVEEIRRRIDGRSNVVVSTFHSMGYRIFKENSDGFELNEFKYKNYIKGNIDSITDYGETASLGRMRTFYISNIVKLADYSRYHLSFTEREIKAVAEKYGIEPLRDEFAVCRKVLIWGKENTAEIDYTDMVWLPNVLNMETRRHVFDWIMIDEAQDATISEQKLIEKCCRRGCRIIAVGDTYQQINIWAGSDEEAIENFKKMSASKELPLPISYRCPRMIVSLAKKFSPNIEAAEWAENGDIRRGVSEYAPQGGDMVLCRITAPLVELHLKYMKVNKKSKINGSESIKEAYLSLIGSVNCEYIDVGMERDDGLILNLYRILLKQVSIVKDRHGLEDEDALVHPSVLSIYDSIKGIMAIAEGVKRTDDLVSKIKQVFTDGDDDAVLLSTVHKAKGMEADNVFIYMPSLMPIKYAKKEWELKTENNLMYVAITRAKKVLSFIRDDEAKERKYSFRGRFDTGRLKDELDRVEMFSGENALKPQKQELRKTMKLGETKVNTKKTRKFDDILD